MMIFLWIIAALLFLFLGIALWLLIAPFALQLNSEEGVLRIKWFSLGQMAVFIDEEEILRFKLQLLFFYWNFTLMHPPQFKSKQKQKKKKAKQKQKRRSKWTFHKIFRKIRLMLYSFQVRHCHFNLDTGNAVWNAYLYPILPLLNRNPSVDAQINWVRIQEVDIDIRNRAYRLLYIFLFK
jgi:hypothetical protein